MNITLNNNVLGMHRKSDYHRNGRCFLSIKTGELGIKFDDRITAVSVSDCARS